MILIDGKRSSRDSYPIVGQGTCSTELHAAAKSITIDESQILDQVLKKIMKKKRKDNDRKKEHNSNQLVRN